MDVAGPSGPATSNEKLVLLDNIEGVAIQMPEERPIVVIYDAPPRQTCCHNEGFCCSDDCKITSVSFAVMGALFLITYGILRLIS